MCYGWYCPLVVPRTGVLRCYCPPHEQAQVVLPPPWWGFTRPQKQWPVGGSRVTCSARTLASTLFPTLVGLCNDGIIPGGSSIEPPILLCPPAQVPATQNETHPPKKWTGTRTPHRAGNEIIGTNEDCQQKATSVAVHAVHAPVLGGPLLRAAAGGLVFSLRGKLQRLHLPSTACPYGSSWPTQAKPSQAVGLRHEPAHR